MIARSLRFLAALVVVDALTILLIPFAAGAQVTLSVPTAADTIPPVRKLPAWAIGQACPHVRDSTLRGHSSAVAFSIPTPAPTVEAPAVMRSAHLRMQAGGYGRAVRAWVMTRARAIGPGGVDRDFCLGYVERVYATSGALAGVPAWRWYAPSLRSGAVDEYVAAWTVPAVHAERYLLPILANFARYPSLPGQ